MVRTHSLVIISVRPWLEMQGLSLGVGGASTMGKLQDKGKLPKFHVYRGNVHASDCGSTHCSGCVVNGISAEKQARYVLQLILCSIYFLDKKGLGLRGNGSDTQLI